jgi:8-oxo-dGTP pyrophosphatase MutT (NUDIX family)
VSSMGVSAICANCGVAGHYYKDCLLPICSFGIVCYRLRVNFHASCIRPEFLMVQRKDSLFFVEFVRGKYDPSDREYIRKMLAGMTKEEQDLLRRAPAFGDLWAHLWSFSHMRNCMTNEFCVSRDKYAALLRPASMPPGIPVAGDATPFLLKTLQELEQSGTFLAELEWGFPKGRRNIYENEEACALREFSEETGVNAAALHVFPHTIEDSFVGSNNVRYAHKYYMAKIVQGGQSASCDMPICSAQQAREVSSVRWMTLKDAMPRLTGNRAKIMERAHRYVVQNIKGRW